MAKVGNRGRAGKPGRTAKFAGTRRVSPLKPGLRGARNWATAQIRSASYSRRKFNRLLIAALVLVFGVVWSGLWLGGFLPQISANIDQFKKQRLVNMGFVVKYVDVVGEGRVQADKVRQMLGVRPGDYLFDMDIESAQERIQSLSWVETVVVRRLWPDGIVVHINERRPYALWQNNQNIHVVDHTGTIVFPADPREFANLPFVVGPGAADHVQSIWTMLSTRPDVQNRTEAMVFVGGRRWDIVLKNGTRILLPELRPASALQRLATYHRQHGLLDLNLHHIDMRVSGRLVLKSNQAVKPKQKHQRA